MPTDKRVRKWVFVALLAALAAAVVAYLLPPSTEDIGLRPPTGDQRAGPCRKVVLAADRPDSQGVYQDTVKDPMQLAISRDGRVFYIERRGGVRVWDPSTRETSNLADLEVFDEFEEGLLGIALDPAFDENGWIYLNYSHPDTTTDANGRRSGKIRLSRFELDADRLDRQSESVLLEVAVERESCCHVAGSLQFDGQGNLYVSTGDNTNPLESGGYTPIDERPGREIFDAQRSAANTNDLRGKILRIRPEPNGGYSIPDGNLFASGLPRARPEIYLMGLRNPFRFGVDRRTSIVYVGDIGPNADNPRRDRGPQGHDEFHQSRGAGNMGWPYFLADNRPYVDFDFDSERSAGPFGFAAPINDSPNNTGLRELPPAVPAIVWYTDDDSDQWPVLDGAGGRTGNAGPIYYFEEDATADCKLPRTFDHTLFLYEWSRNWIIAARLDEDEAISELERFCPGLTFIRPIDVAIGPDGCLYVIEYGTTWGGNIDTQIVRVEYELDATSNDKE